MKTKYCFNCGQEIKTDASFCPKCGAQQEQKKATDLNNSSQNKNQNTNDSYDMDIHKPYNESKHPSIPSSFKLMFRDAFTVKTRMGRADYWYAMLINYVIDIVALIIWASLFNNHPNSITILLSIVSSLFGIITFTASIRRYHDTNKNGWTICFGLIPLIGSIIQLILLCQPSKNKNNHFYKSSDKEWYKNPISWVLLVVFFFISFAGFRTYGGIIHAANRMDTKVGNKTIYSTKINKVYENKLHYWYVTGTTKAPEGAKILAANANRNSMDYGEQGGNSPALTKYATVEDGKFSVLIDPLEVADTNVYEKAGRKANVSIFAITNYHKQWPSVTIPKKYIKAAKDITGHTINLKITHSQAKYFNNL